LARQIDKESHKANKAHAEKSFIAKTRKDLGLAFDSDTEEDEVDL
jgi:hypothetical protein